MEMVTQLTFGAAFGPLNKAQMANATVARLLNHRSQNASALRRMCAARK
jgi:hypothetical protein